MTETNPTFTAEGVFIKHRDQLNYGPFNLKLAAGQGALAVIKDLDLLRRFMRSCLGLEQPDAGRLSWAFDRRDRDDPFWGPYDFFRRIGYVDRQIQLIGSLSLLDNLLLFYQYARRKDGLERSRAILDSLHLADHEHLRADELPEPQRRLGLYALAFAKEPRLLLMERPGQFLDRDFDLVWDGILTRASENGLAFIVFDRTRTAYAAEQFSDIINVAPGAF